MIGREDELTRLERMLDDGTRLMLRGPRGVGVSALLDAAAELARARGLRVLHATGVQWESGFPYAGLHQLLRPLRRRNAMFFQRMVAEAAARDELAPDVDRRGLEDLLGAVAFGLARISAVTGDNRRAVAAVATLQRLLEGTLVSPPPH